MSSIRKPAAAGVPPRLPKRAFGRKPRGTRLNQEADTAPDAAGESGRFPIPILALTMSAFAVGTAEFVIAGLLPDISRDLDVSIPAAGQLVTAYAIGVVIGAPLLAIATSKLPRKAVLLLMLGIFVAGNLLSAVAPGYLFLMVARVVAAFAHGSLFGAGAVVAADMVAPNRRAGAIALMFTGLTVANIAGVPLGTFIGQLYGWRATFWAISGLGVLSFVGIALLVPGTSDRGAIDVRQEIVVARKPEVLLALATTVLGWAGVFVLFTYIVPILEGNAGFSPRAVTIILFVIGVGLTIGINIGGKLADRFGLSHALIGMLAALALFSALFAAASFAKVTAVIVIFLWGMAAFATVPPLQTRVLDGARDAPNLASALNVGAFNLGNAGGAFLGGMVIDWGLGVTAVPLAAALVACSGLVLAAIGLRADRRRSD
jgi:MFS transporter, DHA1 family, inner membrane transport protein